MCHGRQQEAIAIAELGPVVSHFTHLKMCASHVPNMSDSCVRHMHCFSWDLNCDESVCFFKKLTEDEKGKLHMVETSSVYTCVKITCMFVYTYVCIYIRMYII